MPLARTQYTIKALMGVVAAAAVLIAGALLWLRDSPPPAKVQPPWIYLKKMYRVPVKGGGASRCSPLCPGPTRAA